jgi:hypothetical protein
MFAITYFNILLNFTMDRVHSKVVPVSPRVRQIPGRKSKAKFELVFQAKNIPALGFKSYYVKRNPSSANAQMSTPIKIKAKTVLNSGRVTIKY